MDLELLIALWGIWFTIFLGVVVGLSMLLYKSGEVSTPPISLVHLMTHDSIHLHLYSLFLS